MGVRKSKEPDPERARQIAEERCILRAVVGSTVHGLSSPGTDDRDEMGVCIEPAEYVLGLRPFEHWVYRTQPEGRPSGPGDLDLTIYGLRKFCRLAMKGSPTVLLLLFVDEPHVMVRTSLGAELQALAPAFVSKRCGRAFLGYLEAQRRGLLGERHATRTRELSPQHDYDTKYAMHSLRVAYQGIELITTGRISLPIPDEARRHLMAVRRGELPLSQVVADLHAKSSELEQALLAVDLPEAADHSAIDRFLVRAYERAWSTKAPPERT
ncbi:MAG TPA: nucleotidyltransferase domain-containing protein [Solirubrobacteraceae bacterium]